jgi:hypothetical protein
MTTKNVTHKSFIDKLKKKNYRRLGSGLYAEVWASPSSSIVYKISSIENEMEKKDPFPYWVEAVGLRNKNPHLPYYTSYKEYDYKVRGKRRRFYVVKMERLQRWNKNKEAHRALLENDFAVADTYDMHYISPKKVTPAVKKVYLLLDKIRHKGDLDIHDENIMIRMRKNRQYMVLTDPIG